MERSTSVNPGPGEQSLTPGEQKILTLMEQGQQRILTLMEQGQQGLEQRMAHMEERLDRRIQALEEGQQSLEKGQERTNQRLQSLDNKLSDQGEQLRLLARKVEYEGGASKQRDWQLAEDIRRFREEREQKDLEIFARIDQSKQETIASLSKQVTTLRTDVSERLDQHNTRMEMLEQSAYIRETSETSQGLRALTEEVRNLAARLELKADASRVAALEQRLGE
jgi:hypothetical protein